MGIEASYRRITADEWAKLQAALVDFESLNPLERYEVYAAVADADELRSSDRYLSIEKEWHALHVLLTGEISRPSEIAKAPHPLGSVVMGGTELPFDATYDKVRYLEPTEVREVAEALAAISAEALRARFDPAAFTAAEVYPNPQPGGWDIDELEGLLLLYPMLVAFFRSAAQDGNTVLLSFD